MLVGQNLIPRIDLARHLGGQDQPPKKISVVGSIRQQPMPTVPTEHTEVSSNQRKHRMRLAYLLIGKRLTRLTSIIAKQYSIMLTQLSES